MNPKLTLSVFYLFIIIASLSCSQHPQYGSPVADPDKVLRSTVNFLEYREQYLQLYKDFKPLNESLELITKRDFLKLIASGKYLPLRLTSTDTTTAYQLYKIDGSVNTETKEVIKEWGKNLYAYYQTEGTELPDYKFVDLDGKTYTKQTTKGKIMVLKCWFIDCLPCVKEMPALNALKQQYKDRDDIVFVSITWDSSKDLRSFLKRTEFNYAVVPEQEAYLEDSLQLNAYPTHFVINKQGRISKKVTDYREMANVLKAEAMN